MENQKFVYIGVDVAKAKLDVLIDGKIITIENEVKTIKKTLRESLSAPQGYLPCVVCEATGPYHRPLLRAAQELKLAAIVTSPYHVKHFKESMGIRAKNDSIDAASIAQYASMRNLQPIKDQLLTDELQEIVSARDLLVRERAGIKLRLKTIENKKVKRILERSLKDLTTEIERLDTLTWTYIENNPEMKMKANICLSLPGIGKCTTSILLAYLPELGTVSRTRIASLVGIAPYDRDSGTIHGKRMIRAGRKRVRDALYLPTISAIRVNRILKDFYYHMHVEQNKPAKVAIIAAMCKLLIYLNATVRSALEKHS